MNRPQPAMTDHPVGTRLPLSELTAELVEKLGPTLVAYMADVRSRKLPARWAAGEVEPRDEAKRRLLLAYQAFRTVEAEDGPDMARMWLIGANLRLKASPAERIRDGAAGPVLAAVDAFVNDTGGA
jgi:hypothetical protein